jgi:hypothetical protein
MKIDTKSGLAVRLAAQKIADNWNVVTVDCGKEQRWSAIAPFHHTGHGEIGIDRRCKSFDAAPIDHTIERSTKARIEDFRIRNHDSTFAW